MAFERTLAKVRNAFAFPKEFSLVKAYCRSCETFARKRPLHKKDKVQLHPIPIVGEFAHEWVFDVLGPTLKPTAKRRNKHILVCVDQATRFTENRAMSNVVKDTNKLFALRNLQTQTLTDVFVS